MNKTLHEISRKVTWNMKSADETNFGKMTNPKIDFENTDLYLSDVIEVQTRDY